MTKADGGWDWELGADFAQDVWVAGVDEVGRGALFGPVVAAAVLLPLRSLPDLIALGIRDSKQLSARQRSALVDPIRATVGAWQVRYASAREIDRLNILQASLLAMRRAVVNLGKRPDICWVDGNWTIPDLDCPQRAVVGGDRRSPAIAAASILAKVWRDELIVRLAQKYPQYDLAANKGYGSARHRQALQTYGATYHHRRSFAPCRADVRSQQLDLFV